MTVLQPEDDAATVHRGSLYRMPTKAEWNELLERCTWTIMEKMPPLSPESLINYWKVTGPNGNYIILPFAGHYDFSGYKIN